MSDGTNSNAEKIRLLRRATEIYPGAEESSREPLDQAGTNPNNYFGWEALGTALADAGDMEDALKAFQTAARRWPVQAASFAGEVRKAIDAGRLPNPSESPVSRFWFELSTRRPD
jgi:tetratricopeptide (TPR) repeat protein